MMYESVSHNLNFLFIKNVLKIINKHMKQKHYFSNEGI